MRSSTFDPRQSSPDELSLRWRRQSRRASPRRCAIFDAWNRRTSHARPSSVATVAPDATILEAANIMLRQHVSGLPVVDAAGKMVGIVSEGDFIRRSEIGTQRKRGRWLKFLLGVGTAATDYVHEYGRKISDVMTSEPLTVTEDATLEEIVNVMETNSV